MGALICDPALGEEPRLVDSVGAAAALALDNERLEAELRARLEELRASRARIVEAGDSERRRLERDLHDGAQQRLVALALTLRLGRDRAEDAEQRQLLDKALEELHTATRELRELARGIHPAILTDRGLAAAIDALAARAPVDVDLVGGPAERLPPPVEAAAYFVVAEALTNVARYAHARQARVSVSERAGTLTVEVADDGRGGADLKGGSGSARPGGPGGGAGRPARGGEPGRRGHDGESDDPMRAGVGRWLSVRRVEKLRTPRARWSAMPRLLDRCLDGVLRAACEPVDRSTSLTARQSIDTTVNRAGVRDPSRSSLLICRGPARQARPPG